jgi:hypothetical protein
MGLGHQAIVEEIFFSCNYYSETLN